MGHLIVPPTSKCIFTKGNMGPGFNSKIGQSYSKFDRFSQPRKICKDDNFMKISKLSHLVLLFQRRGNTIKACYTLSNNTLLNFSWNSISNNVTCPQNKYSIPCFCYILHDISIPDIT